MPSLTANPTPITPPRCALIDQRTGLIAREWYMFFLSLFQNVSNVGQSEDVAPDTNSALASYEAELQALANSTASAPPPEQYDAALQTVLAQSDSYPPDDLYDDKISELQKQIYGVEQSPGDSVQLSSMAVMQREIDGLKVAPPILPSAVSSGSSGVSAYAAVYDTATQALGAGVTGVISFSNSTFLKNFTKPTASQLKALVGGVYRVDLQAQFYNVSVTNDFVYLWITVNAVNTIIAQTLTVPAFATGTNSVRGHISYLVTLAANDIVQGSWQNTNGDAYITQLLPSGGVIPGAMLTLTYVL